MGRPKVEKPKLNDLKVRVDNEMLKKIDLYCKENKITRAEFLRRGAKKLLGK